MEEIKENHRRLNGCQKHEFLPVNETPKRFTTKYRCKNCNGTIDWYLKGLSHGQI